MNSDVVLTLNALNGLSWPGAIVIVAGIAGLAFVAWVVGRY